MWISRPAGDCQVEELKMTCFGRSAEPERGGHWEVRLKGADLHTLMCLRTLSFTVDRRMAARLFTVVFLQQQGAAE